MKRNKVVMVVLMTTLLLVSVSCAQAKADGTGSSTVNLTEETNTLVSVTGNGNIEAAREITLSFEMNGRLETLNVIEGDTVNAGEILAELDKTDLELSLNNARSARNSATLAYHQSQTAVNQNRIAVDNAEIAVAQAETALHSAEYTLDQAHEFYSWSDISAAEGEISDAEKLLQEALNKLGQTPAGTESEQSWKKTVYYAQTRLNAAKSRFNAMLSGTDTEEAAIKQEQVITAGRSLEAATLALETARKSLDLSEESLLITEKSLELSEEAVALAESQMDKAVIAAPFKARIASVNVKAGSVVSPATAAFHLIDMESLELHVEVDEIDIPGVEPGQNVSIKVDAFPGAVLEGTVRSIGLLPTKSTGLVMYEVRIALDEGSEQGLKVGMSSAADIIISE